MLVLAFLPTLQWLPSGPPPTSTGTPLVNVGLVKHFGELVPLADTANPLSLGPAEVADSKSPGRT